LYIYTKQHQYKHTARWAKPKKMGGINPPIWS
jgi:hypothetical protein